MPDAPDERSDWRPFVKGNPFRDRQGNNPFADAPASESTSVDADAQPADGDPYAASAAGRDAYRPDVFEMTASPRGKVILRMGYWGFLGSVGGCVVGTIAFRSGVPNFPSMACSALPLFCLSLTLPAWLMGRNDLLAMSVGAMPRREQKRTQIGSLLGAIGTLITTVYLALGALNIYTWMWQA